MGSSWGLTREIAKAIDKIIKEHQEGVKYSEAILNKAKNMIGTKSLRMSLSPTEAL